MLKGTIARGDDTHAEGMNTVANGRYQHVQGKYNIADTTSLDIIGNGTTNDNRSNAYTLDTNGNAWYSGDVYVGSTSGTHKDSGSIRLAKRSELDTKVNKTTTIAGINLQDNITVSELVNALKVEMLKIENPVGHIRMETTNTNPATYLGFGTWVLWGAGKVPVGVNTSDTDFASVEKTGGSKTHTHTNPSTGSYSGTTGSHTLTINEIPSHTHKVILRPNGNIGNYWGDASMTNAAAANPTAGGPTTSTGGGKGHTHSIPSHTHTVGNTGSSSNVQPYITCYMWKRTA